MLIIPTAPIPSQTFAVVLAAQRCRINLAQKTTGLFFDLLVNDVLVVAGVICQHANPLVRQPVGAFLGDFAFYDTLGSEDPVFSGLGSRWVLAYLP